MTTQRGEDPAAVLPSDDNWFDQPRPRSPGDDGPGARGAADGADARWAGGPTPSGRSASHRAPDDGPAEGGADGSAGDGGYGSAGDGGYGSAGWDGNRDGAVGVESGGGEESGRRRKRRRAGGDAGGEDPARTDGFDPGDTGTWRVRDVVPGADGGRRHTTILRYLLGLLAVDHLRTLTRWTYVVPVLGLVLLLVKPRWIGLAVVVLGVLMVVGRALATRLIASRSLARRYRPVEDDLRAAVEAGKANLRGELERVGLPSGRLAMPLSVLRLARGTDRSLARSKLREVEIHRILPDAQLQRALKVLDEAAPTGR